jgi:hypothetical protein
MDTYPFFIHSRLYKNYMNQRKDILPQFNLITKSISPASNIKQNWRSYLDLAILAQQATLILAPALPFIVDKSKEVAVEEGIKMIGSKAINRAKVLLKEIKSKKSDPLETALKKVSENSEDSRAKEELQNEILKLLSGNPELASEIEVTINLNVEKVDQLVVGNYNNFFNFGTPSGDEYIKIIEYADQRRKEAANQEILSRYNPSTLPYYPKKRKQFVTENRADELRSALTYLENHRILLLSGIGGMGKTTLARALVDLRPVNVPEPFWLNFNQNQDAKLGDILEKLAAYLKAPEIAAFKAEKREPGKLDVDKFTDELQRRDQVWLIFDDLNTMLEDQQFSDKGIELFFYSLRCNTHRAKIIVTSRILPIFENGDSLLDVVEDEEKHPLNGLRLCQRKRSDTSYLCAPARVIINTHIRIMRVYALLYNTRAHVRASGNMS